MKHKLIKRILELEKKETFDKRGENNKQRLIKDNVKMLKTLTTDYKQEIENERKKEDNTKGNRSSSGWRS